MIQGYLNIPFLKIIRRNRFVAWPGPAKIDNLYPGSYPEPLKHGHLHNDRLQKFIAEE